MYKLLSLAILGLFFSFLVTTAAVDAQTNNSSSTVVAQTDDDLDLLDPETPDPQTDTPDNQGLVEPEVDPDVRVVDPNANPDENTGEAGVGGGPENMTPTPTTDDMGNPEAGVGGGPENAPRTGF